MANGLILRYIIIVTVYSTGQSVYTNMVSAGGGLSDMVTGLGKMHGSKLFWVDIVKITACNITYVCMYVCMYVVTQFQSDEKRTLQSYIFLIAIL